MNPFIEDLQIEEFSNQDWIDEMNEDLPEMDDLMSDLPFDTSFDF